MSSREDMNPPKSQRGDSAKLGTKPTSLCLQDQVLNLTRPGSGPPAALAGVLGAIPLALCCGQGSECRAGIAAGWAVTQEVVGGRRGLCQARS